MPAHKDKAMNEEQFIAAAREAALKAYAPYSRFSVGCAIESVDGAVVTGVNVENACYRLGVCAEQSALSAAHLAFGLQNVARIAVVRRRRVRRRALPATVVCHALRRLPPGDLRSLVPVRPRHRDHLLQWRRLRGRAPPISTLIPHGFGPANLKDAG